MMVRAALMPLVMAAALGASAPAQEAVRPSAQAPQPWSGYVPGAAWGAPGAAVGVAPARAAAGPAPFRPQAAGPAWAGYRPEPGGSRPGASMRSGGVPGPTPRGYGYTTPAGNREHGTGRHIDHRKPWLPGAYHVG